MIIKMATTHETKLEVLGYDEKEKTFTVKSPVTGYVCKIHDTFAETFTLMEISPAIPLFSVLKLFNLRML